MKIVFFPSGNLPFHARTLEERPLGGMETAVIRLAEALSRLGHRVSVLSGIQNPPLSDPLYIPINRFQDAGPADVLVAIREWKPLCLPFTAKLKTLWTGDSYDQPQNVGIGDKRIIEKLDVLLPVSSWHLQRLCEESGFPVDKAQVLPNGVHMPYFAERETRVRKRMIYSSTPYRGLAHLPAIFSRIKERHPDAELHVFSGYKVYSGPNGYDSGAVAEYTKLVEVLNSIPGCTVHGNVRQDQLAREFMKSSVLAYPNTFEETSCITAMEAQAAGCATISSRKGALPETVGKAGILIPGEPGTKEYQSAFLDALDHVFSDDKAFEKLSKAARSQALAFDWNAVAANFAKSLETRLSAHN